MKKFLILLLLIPSWLYAQAPSGKSVDVPGAFSMPSDTQDLRPAISRQDGKSLLHESQTYQYIPKNISEEKRTEILSIMKKLSDACPECATGASPGGPVVVGPGAGVKSTAPLFGKGSPEYIRVLRSDYQKLREKADAYDALKK